MSTPPYKVLVLSSYIYDEANANPYAKMGRRNGWFKGFVKSIVQGGSGLRDFDVRFQATPADNGELAKLTASLGPQNTDIVICPGTDSAVRVAKYLTHVPMLYFGAHPESNGMELLLQPNVTGVRLNLPLIWSLENFGLLKAVVPQLKRIYFPLNTQSAFGFDNVRQAYRSHRSESDSFWIPGASSWTGYRSLHLMASALGLEYFEGPYESAAALAKGLEDSDPKDAIYVGFNDSVLDDQATAQLLTFVERKQALLCWVNNPGIIEHLGLADFSSDFEAVGRSIGRLALRIARDGELPKDIPLQPDPGQRLLVNLRTATRHGLQVPGSVLAKFNEIVPVLPPTPMQRPAAVIS